MHFHLRVRWALAPRSRHGLLFAVVFRALLPTFLGVAACASPQPPITLSHPVPSSPRASVGPLRTLVADGRFDDLEPLVAAIGDAHVVALGEPSHLDGAALDVKVRLVEFLHERLGFDVIAWEANVWGCEQMDAQLDDPSSGDVRSIGMGWPWERAQQVAPLFAYAKATRETARPLHMAGIDPQFSINDLQWRFRDWLVVVAERALVLTPEQRAQLLEAFTRFPKTRSFAPLSIEVRAHDRAVFQALHQRLAGTSDRDRSLALRALEAVDALYRWHEDVHADVSTKIAWDDHVALNNVRNAAMADTLLWLRTQRFPGQRIVVWGANVHIARTTAGLDLAGTKLKPEAFRDNHSMGEALARALGRDYFAIASTAFEGTIGNPPRSPPHPLESSPPGSLEARIAKQYPLAAWVDLQAFDPSPSVARFIGYQTIGADWGAVFDAAIVMHTMTPVVGD